MATTLLGIALLWRAGAHRDAPWSAKAFVAALFSGWGWFNLVDGLINHHFLQLHHLIETRGLSIADFAFLASGVIFILAGWMTIRSSITAPLRA